MTYDVAVEKLLALGHELHHAPPKFDLVQMQVLVEGLGHPERRFPSVLIAGTNGKGSTAATLASILRAAGYRTGLYTSPHLVRINERIQLDGEEISEPEFAEMLARVEATARELVAAGKLPHPPSFFETLTAMAFEYFASSAVDIAVLEVGMGGRLDATNVVEPVLSVITDVALDHQKYLGNTIAEIALEKAGIIRGGRPVVTLPQHPQATDAIGKVAMERGARAVSAVPFMPDQVPGAERWSVVGSQWSEEPVLPTTDHQPPSTSYPLQVLGVTITVASPLIGRHQLRNLALAIAAAAELARLGFGKVTPRTIERGIRETRWPGRLQLVEREGQHFLLDVAHNPAGAWALRSALSTYFGERPLVFVFAAMRDKAVGEMAEILFPLAERVVATQVENPRAATPEEIAAAAARTGAEVVCEPQPTAALTRARALAQGKALVVVTGSIYLVGEALKQLAPGRR